MEFIPTSYSEIAAKFSLQTTISSKIIQMRTEFSVKRLLENFGKVNL